MALNKKIVLGIFVLAFLVMSVVPVCGQSDFSFYAVYDRLADTESLEGQIWCAAMSGDGNRLIFSTTSDTFLYTVNADGSDLTSIPLPADIAGIAGVTINKDGSRAFFFDNYYRFIYRVEGGVATQILDTNDYSEIGRCMGIETTAGGDYVYFMEDRDDVWRIRHGGGTPEKVIEDTEVPREEGSQSHGRKVKDFAISADGSTIAFVLYYYVDPTDGDRFKEELFVLDGDGYRQLTNDDKNVYKSYFDISGDGTTIVFSASSPQNKWYSIHSDGSAKIALEAVGSGGDLALNYDGMRMFYYDAGANGGRLVNTDGSGSIDLFPSWSAGAIMIAATFDLCISDDGRRVSFRYISGGGPLYIGYLNDPDAVPDSPTIHNIVFDPPAMPRGDPDARVIVTSEISDPQGLADIERTSINELVDGRLEGSSSNVPVYFYLSYYGGTRDEGDWPDETAGDGIFSNAGRPGGKIDELDQMTVRMGAMDASKTVVIADKVLSIGGVMPTPTPTQTPTPTPTLTLTPTTTPSITTPIPTVTPTPTLPTTPPITPPEFSGLIFESRSKSSGSMVQIPLTLKGVKEKIGNMDITLGYDDSVLEATEVIKGGLTTNSLFEYNILDGTVKISLADKAGFSGDGSIAYIRFIVIGYEGSVSPLEIVSLSANRAEDMALMNIPTQDGLFTVISVEQCRGDCTGDGKITAADALCALQMAVGKRAEDLVMDVNGDGKVSSVDAREILKKAVAAGLEEQDFGKILDDFEKILDDFESEFAGYSIGELETLDTANDGTDDTFNRERDEIEEGLFEETILNFEMTDSGDKDYEDYEYMIEIPKSFATSVDDLEFSVPPDRVTGIIIAKIIKAKDRLIALPVAAGRDTDIAICEGLPPGFPRDICFAELAKERYMPSLCDKIGNSKYKGLYIKDVCFLNLAKATNMPFLCDKISNSKYRGIYITDICYIRMALMKKDELLCDKIGTAGKYPNHNIVVAAWKKFCINKLPTCGYYGLPCCPDKKCYEGECQSVHGNWTCIHCGAWGERCCQEGEACYSVYESGDTRCINERCQYKKTDDCGHVGYPPCVRDGRSVCYYGVLRETTKGSICEACGDYEQPCCQFTDIPCDYGNCTAGYPYIGGTCRRFTKTPGPTPPPAWPPAPAPPKKITYLIWINKYGDSGRIHVGTEEEFERPKKYRDEWLAGISDEYMDKQKIGGPFESMDAATEKACEMISEPYYVYVLGWGDVPYAKYGGKTYHIDSNLESSCMA